MKASVMIQRLGELVELYGDLELVIKDSMCDQDLRSISRTGIAATGTDEIQIEAFE